MRREAEEKRRAEEERRASLPPLTQCLNMHDFEQVGRMAMSPEAWAYYSSAADDNEAMHENEAVFRRIWFRPRVLRDVKHVDPSTYILGIPTSLPIYVTPTALGGMAIPRARRI